MITVHKLDHNGKEEIANGELISRNDNGIVLERSSNMDDGREYATLNPEIVLWNTSRSLV